MGNGVAGLREALQSQVNARRQAAFYDNEMQARQAQQEAAGQQQQQGLAMQLQAGLVRAQQEEAARAAQQQAELGAREKSDAMHYAGTTHAAELQAGAHTDAERMRIEQQAKHDEAQAAWLQKIQDAMTERATAGNASKERIAGKPRVNISVRTPSPGKPGPDPMLQELITARAKYKEKPYDPVVNMELETVMKKWMAAHPGVPAPAEGGGSILKPPG